MKNFLISTLNADFYKLLNSFFTVQKDFRICRLKFDNDHISDADFLLIDMITGNRDNYEIIKSVKRINRHIRIIVLTDSSDPDSILNYFRQGAGGILSPGSLINELNRCIHTLYLGERYIPVKIVSNFLEYIIRTPYLDEHRSFLLSPREKEHISYIAEGLNSKEIAQKLKISRKTADNYKNRIMNKLNLNSIADLVKYAIRSQIIAI